MSKRSYRKNFKDYYNRRKFARTELKKNTMKAIYNNNFLPLRIRQNAYYELSKLHKYGSPTKIKNRCILTGHTRSILRDFRMGRCQFSELASAGKIPGVKKASW